MVVEAVLLEEVDDPELVGDPGQRTPDPEVVPLGVSLGVQVGL